MSGRTVIRGLGAGLVLTGCAATTSLPPDEQARVYRGAVDFVQAHAIASGCETLALDEAAVERDASALLGDLENAGYDTADVTGYLRAVPGETLGAAAREQLAAKGVTVTDLRNPAPDPALCALGVRERRADTQIGRMLTDA